MKFAEDMAFVKPAVIAILMQKLLDVVASIRFAKTMDAKTSESCTFKLYFVVNLPFKGRLVSSLNLESND